MDDYRKRDPQKVLSPGEMVKNWESAVCNCDMEVGWLCERCHDIQVVEQMMAELEELRHRMEIIHRLASGESGDD